MNMIKRFLKQTVFTSQEDYIQNLHINVPENFNFAFDGDYRYQDHNRNTPAIGGGMSIGYRLPISRNNRWRLELSLGAGVYSCHYDKFYNTPRTKDGLKIESIRDTYWGVDQAAVSFTYSFDLNKKGGGKR